MIKGKIRLFSSVRGGSFFEGLAKYWEQSGWPCEITSVMDDNEYRLGSATAFGGAKRRYGMYLSAACKSYKISRQRRVTGEICVTTTNPFFAPYISSRRLFGALGSIYWQLDLYPDALTAAGYFKQRSIPDRLLGRMTHRVLKDSAGTVFLGRRLQKFTEEKYGTAKHSVVIPIGTDASVFPEADFNPDVANRNLSICYVGLMGRLHDWETIAKTIKQGIPEAIRLSFFATGAGYEAFRSVVNPKDNPSLILEGGLEARRWTSVMKSQEVALVTLKRGAGEVVMPSKVYSAMAAGQAIIAICEEESDLADLIKRHDCGWVIPPGDISGLSALFQYLPVHRSEVRQKRINSFAAAKQDYDLPIIARGWDALFDRIEDERRENARRSKILYIHQHFCLPSGKGGTRSYEISKSLIADKKDVTLVCGLSSLSGISSDHGRSFTYEGIDIKVCPVSYANELSFRERLSKFAFYVFYAMRYVIFSKYDVIYATSTPLSAGIPGIFAKALRRKIFVFEERDRWPAALVSIGLLKSRPLIFALTTLEKISYKMADACVGLSPGIVSGIIAEAPKDKRVEFVPNGSDISLFRKGSKGNYENVLLDSNKKWVVYVGTHGLANGLDVVLDAAGLLCESYQDKFQFVFAGEGMEKARLVARKEAERLENCVFLGSLPKNEVAHLLAAADLGLLVMKNTKEFYYGTSPNKFFDYLAAGLPVVNNYPGWAAELIQKWQCGVVVPPDSPGELADAIKGLLTSGPDMLDKLGDRARRLAEAEFSREKLNAKICDLVNDLMYQRMFGGKRPLI